MNRRSRHRIAVIPGDGIGPEIIQEACRLIEAIAAAEPRFHPELEVFDWGSEYYLQYGVMLPERGLEILSAFDAILLGAIGDPRVPDRITLRNLVLAIRRQFDQYVNLRPIKLIDADLSPLRTAKVSDIDMTLVRENTEGEYVGEGSRLWEGSEQEIALQLSVFSRLGVHRILRYAFEMARATTSSLTSISKGNALNYTCALWDEIFEAMRTEYPDVETHTYLVDAAALHMVRDPSRFEIVVAPNLFGDIISDLGAALVGGMGLAASANLNPEGRFPSMFEPVHGSAPDIAGASIANPMAAFWTVGLMLQHFQFGAWEAAIIDAIHKVLIEDNVCTPDLGGHASTQDVTTAFLARLIN